MADYTPFYSITNEYVFPSLFICQYIHLPLLHCHSQTFHSFNLPKTGLVELLLHYLNLTLPYTVYFCKINFVNIIMDVTKSWLKWWEHFFVTWYLHLECCITWDYIVTDMVIFAADSRLCHMVVLFHNVFFFLGLFGKGSGGAIYCMSVIV